MALEHLLNLLNKYDTAGPRYTSYPTANLFAESITFQDYQQAATHSVNANKPLSLYVHIPFCDTICYYCACNKIVTKNRAKAVDYIEHLVKEIALQGMLFKNKPVVKQLHFGGGTPTFLTNSQLSEIIQAIKKHFSLATDIEFSIEIDPREANREIIQGLREIGFNRLSLGIQDFNEKVQLAVNRLQSRAQTLSVLQAGRDFGFESISVDLIYGLPHQTKNSFLKTLEEVVAIDPDRLSIFNYAHLPERFRTQRQMDEKALPSPAKKLDILTTTISYLTSQGYVYIGMDHFAKPDDPLSQAQRQGTLYRNFQGYSTHADCDLLGLGVSSIGMIGNGYFQNSKTLEGYYQALDYDRLPIERGLVLTEDDRLRREVITQLICHFYLDKKALETKYQISFADYFTDDLKRLEPLRKDGLLIDNDEKILVTESGRLLIRHLCMAFDRHLQEAKNSEVRFSKVI